MIHLEQQPRILRPHAEHIHRLPGGGELYFPQKIEYGYQQLKNYPKMARAVPWSMLEIAADCLRQNGRFVYDKASTPAVQTLRNAQTNLVEAVQVDQHIFEVEDQQLVFNLSSTYQGLINWRDNTFGLRSKHGVVFYTSSSENTTRSWQKVSLTLEARATITKLLEKSRQYYLGNPQLTDKPLVLEPKHIGPTQHADWYRITVSPTEATWLDAYGNTVSLSEERPTNPFLVLPESLLSQVGQLI